MKYTKFSIRNYKGIPNIEINLISKPSIDIFTLVGLNESGKTSILEAINLFQNDIIKDEAYTLIPKSEQHIFTGIVSVEATIQLSDSDKEDIAQYLKDKHKYKITKHDDFIKITKKYSFQKAIPTEESYLTTSWSTQFIGIKNRSRKEDRLYKTHKEAWNDLTSFIKEKYLPKILYYPDFLFEFPEKIYIEKYENEGREQEEYRSILQDILHSINKDLNLQEDLLAKMQNNERESYKASLKQLRNKIEAKLNEDILKKWDEIFASTQKKEVEVEWGKDDIGGYFVEIKIKQGSDSYSINHRSLGFKWFFSFLIFTHFRKLRKSDPGETLFLLDEPASNLHQRSQQKLLQSLDDIVSNCKLIYSTHSHHLINPKWLAGTYIIKNKAINYNNPEDAETTNTEIVADLYKNFVASHPNEDDHYKPILDSLQYLPSQLELVPFIIFTEGKNDYYTFKYFQKIILKEKYQFHFYPGAGVNKYEDVFRLYIAWNKDFLGCFDGDNGGKKAKNKYEKEIGPAIIGRIFTLNEINEAWTDFATEHLFGESEQIRVIQKAFPDYKKEQGFNKSKFYTAIQELYINNESFTFKKDTIDNFTTIFEFIKQKQ